MSYTFVELKVSRETYNEIYEKLALAQYHQAFLKNDTLIDMHGIALSKQNEKENEENTEKETTTKA